MGSKNVRGKCHGATSLKHEGTLSPALDIPDP
jgi:hypothetical protein